MSDAEWWREISGVDHLTAEEVVTAHTYGSSSETDPGVRDTVQSCPDPGKMAAIR